MNQTKPRRILHIVGAMNAAGTETMLMNIYRNMDRDHVQFDFISYSKQDAHYDEEIKSLGGKVIKLSHTQSIKELCDAIKQYGPYDVIHSHTLFHCGIASVAAKLCGVKVRISHAHTTLDRSGGFIREMYMKSMRSIIHMFSTDLLACSQEAGSYLFGAQRLKQPKYTYFPNLVDYPKFLNVHEEQVNRFKLEEGLENGIVIGHIGRFTEAKNHTFLLEIMKQFIHKGLKIKLLLIGEGELRKQIDEAAKNEGLSHHIRFVGIRDDIPILLHSMDLFVFPSIYEGLGLVLLEAQACGLPCVVSEAIQPEADLKLGLVSRLPLGVGADAWADQIIERAGKKERDTQQIIHAFERNGYSIPAGISKLMNIYQI